MQSDKPLTVEQRKEVATVLKDLIDACKVAYKWLEEGSIDADDDVVEIAAAIKDGFICVEDIPGCDEVKRDIHDALLKAKAL